MRISRLSLKNFRGIRDLDIDFDPYFTVIVGKNGSGKTSILDGIAALLQTAGTESRKFERITDLKEVGLSRQDIRIGADATSLEMMVTFADPLDHQGLSLTSSGKGHLDGIAVRGHSSLRKAWIRASNLPRSIYYRQQRGFEPGGWQSHRHGDVLNPEDLQAQSMKTDIRAIGDLEKWWDHLDAQEARIVRDEGNQGYRDPQLEAVRSLIAGIDDFSGISFEGASTPRGLHLLKKDGTRVHVSSLSSGERCYIVLLADLARRLQVFALGRSLESIPAIVLIDEIELNLHPTWQSKILNRFRTVFRACQFIVTTYSPQVLSGIESDKVRILEVDPSGSTSATIPLSTRGRTSNSLLEGVLGASQRSPGVAKLIYEFNRAVDDGDLDTAKETFDQVEAEIEGSSSIIRVLRKRLESLERDS